jgi:hypothetical protein
MKKHAPKMVHGYGIKDAWAESVAEVEKAQSRLKAATIAEAVSKTRATTKKRERWQKKVTDLAVIELNLRRIAGVQLAPPGPRHRNGDA